MMVLGRLRRTLFVPMNCIEHRVAKPGARAIAEATGDERGQRQHDFG